MKYVKTSYTKNQMEKNGVGPAELQGKRCSTGKSTCVNVSSMLCTQKTTCELVNYPRNRSKRKQLRPSQT